MDEDQHIWRVWANFLQRWGVDQWAASLLESAEPVSLLGAQMVYMVQPFLRYAMPDAQLDALSRLLEEPQRLRAFITLLREAPSQ